VVNYKKDYEVYAPTAFVPNNDGINDEYMVKYKILENYSYNFQIFNNLGVLIFESSEPAASWNGLIGNRIAPKGKYLWKLTITDPQKKIEQYDDYFILIRKN
jgi:gliding motility-associated-like protein